MKKPLSSRARKAAALLAAAGACAPAAAHVFSQPYVLPVPFAMYALAATAALLLSFVMVGLFAVLPAAGRRSVPAVEAREHAPRGRPVWLLPGRIASAGLLLLCIVSGLVGTQNAFLNFNMTFFWIVFVLAVPYLVALVGDFYAPLNPWKAVVGLVELARGRRFDGIVAWPRWLGTWPALALYLAFIWLELFGQLMPRGLSVALCVYTGVNVAGAWVFGREAWFRHGEFFGVFLRLIGRMSPRARPWDPDEPFTPGTPRWRMPFVGLLQEPVRDTSGVLFILFMLSSTAFDGLHSTLPWVQLYWKGIYPDLAPWLGPASPEAFRRSTEIYHAWQWLALAVSPFVYLGVFAAAIAVVKAVTGSTLPVRELVLRFTPSLVPIAFVYHLTHYYTLVFAQGGQLLVLASDPLGRGWNLFGTAGTTLAPVMLDVGEVWLTQVTLIVAGHVASVWLAHLEALRIFPSSRRAALSQLPMLALMMVFTNLGLWILSLPIAGG